LNQRKGFVKVRPYAPFLFLAQVFTNVTQAELEVTFLLLSLSNAGITDMNTHTWLVYAL
jgi:hypothetical protein